MQNMTVEEAGLRLGKSPATVRRLLALGELNGQKFGNRWIVYGDALPKRPTRTTSKSPPSVNVNRALRHVLRLDRRELWVPDILNWEDFRASPDAVLSAASEKCVSGAADPFEVVEVPKGDLLSRAGTLLSLEDRVAFHALCSTFASRLDGLLSDHIYSSRLNPASDSDFFKHGYTQWKQFTGAVQAECVNRDKWVVKTDLVSYFETIGHQLLFEDLQAAGVPASALTPLRHLLREWRQSSHHGLPIGMDASRLLGNFFMRHIDEIMLESGIAYHRYMDDIRLVASSKDEALAALRQFEVHCRNRGLIVSGAKTSLHEVRDPKDVDGLDPRLTMADYFFRNGLGEARKSLRDLFVSALDEPALNRKHAKFALLRLGSIVDRGILTKLLTRLDHLQEVAPDSALYLRSFISEAATKSAITSYLSRAGNPGVEVYQQAWLIATMLEILGNPPKEWVSYGPVIAFDANRPTYLRCLAMSLVAIGQRPIDLAAIKSIARKNYDPALVRGALTALRRVDALDKQTITDSLKRLPQLEATISYLVPRESLPSLMQEGLWAKVRAVPNSS